MKKIISQIIVSAVSAVFIFSGCTSEKEQMSRHHFGNKLYINTSTDLNEIFVRPDGTTTVTKTLTVGVPLQAETKITGKIVADPSLADTYRTSYYDEDAIALDASFCRIQDGDIEIEAGSNTSGKVTLEFGDISTLDGDKVYVMPVTLTDVEGVDVLNSKTTVYYVFKGAALISVVADMTKTRAWPVWQNPKPLANMYKFTMECLVFFNRLDKDISTIMGIEEKFLLRVGDAGLPKNQLQIVGENDTLNVVKFEVNKWYHLAVTYDNGTATVYVNGEKTRSKWVDNFGVNFSVPHSNESGPKIERCFWVGYSFSDARYLDGKIAEARIWNRVLTEEEINAPDHFYIVRPDSEGLVTYWKFDDGKGNVIKDHTVNENHLYMADGEAPEWVPVELPIK